MRDADTELMERQLLASMRRTYLLTLPAKVLELEALWLRLAHAWDEDSAQVLRFELHTICGTTGTCELKTLSEEAHGIERAVAVLLDEKRPPAAQEVGEIRRRLKEMREAAAAAKAAQRSPSPAAAPFAAPPAATHGVGKILVVEDEPRLSSYLVDLLRTHGFAASSAADGVAADTAISVSKPDLVLCDVLLPRLDGFALCKKIKADPALRHVRVILMTAVYKKPRYHTQAKDCGADGFLEKPIDADTLLGLVRELLAQGR